MKMIFKIGDRHRYSRSANLAFDPIARWHFPCSRNFNGFKRSVLFNTFNAQFGNCYSSHWSRNSEFYCKILNIDISDGFMTLILASQHNSELR